MVDECRRTGCLGEAVLAHLAEAAPAVRARLLAGADTYIPLGPAMDLTLPSRDGIVAAALGLLGR
jgi:2-oxoisovalerate dehydrogenase E1 component